MHRKLCYQVKPMEERCSDMRERNCYGLIKLFQVFLLAAARSLLDLFFGFVATERSNVARKQPNVHANQHPEDHRMCLQELGAVLRLEVCLPVRDVNASLQDWQHWESKGEEMTVSLGNLTKPKSRQKQRWREFSVCTRSMPLGQKPECTPSNGPTERRLPASSMALFATIPARVLSSSVFAQLILRIAHPLLKLCLVRGNGLPPKHQELGRGQP